MVDQYINGEADTFVPGDLFAVALHFHAGNLVQEKPANNAFIRGCRRGFRQGGRQPWIDGERDRIRDKEPQSQPPAMEGFPDDISFKYNYRSCTGKCNKSHVCRNCRGHYKTGAAQCPSAKK